MLRFHPVGLASVLLVALSVAAGGGLTVVPSPSAACGACLCEELRPDIFSGGPDGIPVNGRIFVWGADAPAIALTDEGGAAVPFHLEPTGGQVGTHWVVPDAAMPAGTSFTLAVDGQPFPFTTSAVTDESAPVIGSVEADDPASGLGAVCGPKTGFGVRLIDVTDDGAIQTPPVRLDVTQDGETRTILVRSSPTWPGLGVAVGHSEAGLDYGISSPSCLGTGEIGLLRPDVPAHVTVRVHDAAGNESAPVELDVVPAAIDAPGCGGVEGSGGGGCG